MEIKEIEGRIERLKKKVSNTQKAEGDKGGPDRLREARKKLKRAQRRKKVLTVRSAFIEAKGKKKVKAGEGEKPAS